MFLCCASHEQLLDTLLDNVGWANWTACTRRIGLERSVLSREIDRLNTAVSTGPSCRPSHKRQAMASTIFCRELLSVVFYIHQPEADFT